MDFRGGAGSGRNITNCASLHIYDSLQEKNRAPGEAEITTKYKVRGPGSSGPCLHLPRPPTPHSPLPHQYFLVSRVIEDSHDILCNPLRIPLKPLAYPLIQGPRSIFSFGGGGGLKLKLMSVGGVHLKKNSLALAI